MKNGRILSPVVGALLAWLGGCGGDSPTTPPPSPPPVATTPSPSPSPSAPTTQGCSLPAMPECSPPGGGGCCKPGADRLGEFVELAIRQVQQDHPEWFDGERIKNPDETADLIVAQVARTLEQRYGLCAKAGSPVDDEVAVKRTNEFSEQYDIIIGDGLAVNHHGYTVTCRPARF